MLVIPLVALAASGGAGTGRLAVKAGGTTGGPSTAVASVVTPDAVREAAVPDSGPQVTVVAAGVADATEAPAHAPTTRVTAVAASHVSPVVSSAARSTTTSPPTTQAAPTTTAAPRPQHSQSGQASYYTEAPNGTCAHPTLPFGTVVSIVDTDNGRTASCTVEDRGPYAGGRIIDLAQDVFTRLAPTSQGVINVRISW